MRKWTIAIIMMFAMMAGSVAAYGIAQDDTSIPVPTPAQNVNFALMQNGLRGDYFNSMDLTNPITFRLDREVNFKWGGSDKPILGLNHNNFSVRWSGYILPSFNEVYKFYTQADDGVRLYINDVLVINDWNQHGVMEQSGSVRLTAGQPYLVRLEYFQYTSTASVKLSWSSNSQRKEVVPYEHLYSPMQPTAVKGSGNGLQGYYFSDRNMTNQTSKKVDKKIDMTFKSSGIFDHNGFSVRWLGKIQPLYSENYIFRTVSDDGVRLWINGQLIIDRWNDNSDNEGAGAIALTAGQSYDIKIEYYNNRGSARVSLYWSSPSQPLEIVPTSQLYTPPAPQAGTGTGLKGEYFTDKTLTNLRAVTVDPDINFDWGNRGLPIDGVPHNGFSARWTGKVQPLYTESYTIKTISDDGVRVYINGKLLIDDWTVHSAKADTAKIDLQAGQLYDIRIEYYQETGKAGLELYWSSPSQKSEIISQKQLYQ